MAQILRLIGLGEEVVVPVSPTIKALRADLRNDHGLGGEPGLVDVRETLPVVRRDQGERVLHAFAAIPAGIDVETDHVGQVVIPVSERIHRRIRHQPRRIERAQGGGGFLEGFPHILLIAARLV